MNTIARAANRLGLRSYQPLKYTTDVLLWAGAGPLAFVLRLEAAAPRYLQEIVVYSLLGLGIKLLAVAFFALPRQSWHKVGVRDLYMLLRAVTTVALVMLALAFLINPVVQIPRSIPLLEGGIALGLLSVTRLGLRILHENTMRGTVNGKARRVLVVGAGEAGTMIAREMLRHPESGLKPVGFVDDDLSLLRQRIFDLPVFGPIDVLPAVVQTTQPDEILIAMPSAPGEVIRRVLGLARQTRIQHRIIPGVYDILSGKVSISQIREVDVEDLLRREPVRLDMAEIAAYLHDRRVLVTGSGGSIGSEIVRQVLRFSPRQIILLDRDENSLYLLSRDLQREWPLADFQIVVADIQRKGKLERVFERYRPQVVFHAAANKHVPVMEKDPDEAVLNNVVGTRNLIDLAMRYDVTRFVNISTDKAVNPSSVMGATKRVAEHLVEHAASQAAPDQCFVSVRFGNVLGSRGSVVPIFKEQIQRGGPVTVTHSDMKRYFMSIPEATQLVLQAAGLGQNGAVYVLDMGEPVRIIDLARDLIALSGLEPDVDIPIEVTGLRDGEKLFEELLTPEEGTTATRHEKIFVARKTNGPPGSFNGLLEELIISAERCDSQRIRELLARLTPGYAPALPVTLDGAAARSAPADGKPVQPAAHARPSGTVIDQHLPYG
jgi:FlaA1/EpsC-like NDP-sugar epimerase